MEYVLSLFHLCPLAIFVESRKLIELYFDWSSLRNLLVFSTKAPPALPSFSMYKFTFS